MSPQKLTTGLTGLDHILKGLMVGDNVVWQVDTIDDYIPFVHPFVQNALKKGIPCVYFRFASHRALIPEDWDVLRYDLNPEESFESFIAQIHDVIQQAGRGAYYVFDVLSDLAGDWCSDRMVGNFFMLTCPYLFDMETIAYFGILRNMHTDHALMPITQTTQLFLNVYRHKQQLFVQPSKVAHRYSPTMYMLHAREEDQFTPVTDSATITEILTAMPWSGLEPIRRRLGAWDRAFLHVEKVWNEARGGTCSQEEARQTLRHALRMILSREERMLELAEKYMTLEDVLAIRRRVIGTGLIGGKAGGMYLARAILCQSAPHWRDLLEPHDSFFIGSDVFYTYLVQNGCWWGRQKQRSLSSFMEGAEDTRRRILTGQFPDYIREEFTHLLNYFGQSPIIIRSSSLLEDNFGNAFAGKYDSVFLTNQGPPERRLEDFMSAVRLIYSSTMSEKALQYRQQRGLLERDEQMALLIQRVSGSLHGRLFYPQAAGVALSHNPYVWSEQIDPKAGVLRLVFGLGTRAVDRVDDDYTRVVALNAPERRPEHNFDQIRQYAQRKVDVLNWEANQLGTENFEDVLRQNPSLPLEFFASPAPGTSPDPRGDLTRSASQWVVTFDKLLKETSFVRDMRRMLHTLHNAYEYPVEVEFALNFNAHHHYKINLLQCRPLQIQGEGPHLTPPSAIEAKDLLLEAHGAVIGQSSSILVERLVYVPPSVYGAMPVSQRPGVARRIGRILKHLQKTDPKTTVLLGPGRWGTTSPSLGIPVNFAEINTVSALCEIVTMHEGLTPEVSLGTHFFNELVESQILYMALFPGRSGNTITEDFFENTPSQLQRLAPDHAEGAEYIHIIDVDQLPDAPQVHLFADCLKQTVLCYKALPTRD